MNGPRLFCLLAALLASVPAAAAADEQERQCRDDRGVDRCDPAQQARVRAMYNVPAIETHRDAGDQVRRALYVDGDGNDVIAIVFIRPPGRDPELRVHFRHVNGEPDAAPLTALVPPDQWRGLIDRSDQFDRELVPLPPPPDDREEVICMHSWVFTVEAADPARSEGQPASVRRRTEDACADGLTEAYAVELYNAALALLPHCARLDSRRYRHPAYQLSNCRYLGGDRIVAATVLNLADPLFRLSGQDDLQRVAPLFEHDATIDWNGERNPTGDPLDGAARFLLAKWAESGRPDFYVESIEGERFDRVRLRGALLRTIPAAGGQPERRERALVEMAWEGEGEDFGIRTIRIGPFEPFAPR